MWNDEIVDEVRRVREQYVAEHHDDLDEIYRDLLTKEQREWAVYCEFSAETSDATC